jgi:hypothetical protein
MAGRFLVIENSAGKTRGHRAPVLYHQGETVEADAYAGIGCCRPYWPPIMAGNRRLLRLRAPMDQRRAVKDKSLYSPPPGVV